jgi:hypothetical protein
MLWHDRVYVGCMCIMTSQTRWLYYFGCLGYDYICTTWSKSLCTLKVTNVKVHFPPWSSPPPPQSTFGAQKALNLGPMAVLKHASLLPRTAMALKWTGLISFSSNDHLDLWWNVKRVPWLFSTKSKSMPSSSSTSFSWYIAWKLIQVRPSGSRSWKLECRLPFLQGLIKLALGEGSYRWHF